MQISLTINKKTFPQLFQAFRVIDNEHDSSGFSNTENKSQITFTSQFDEFVVFRKDKLKRLEKILQDMKGKHRKLLLDWGNEEHCLSGGISKEHELFVRKFLKDSKLSASRLNDFEILLSYYYGYEYRWE